MSISKKGNNWHFGMKMHSATNDSTNAVYGPANEYDIVRARNLISEETKDVYGDTGYLGVDKTIIRISVLDQPASGEAQAAFT